MKTPSEVVETLLFDYMRTLLEALIAQAEFAKSETYCSSATPEKFAACHAQFADRALLMVEAFSMETDPRILESAKL